VPSGLHWRVETVDAPILWTCDRPLMPWRPPSAKDRYEGLRYANADEIRMPLSPVAMLILRRQASVSPVQVDKRRFHDYNADIALQCYEFVVCLPGRRGRLDNANIVRNRPAVRFHIGLGLRRHATGHTCRWGRSFRSGFHCARSTHSQGRRNSRSALPKRLSG